MDNGEVVMTRRQCTSEYKIKPVDQYIRRTILGLKPKQRIPKGTVVTQLFGFSVDEAGRGANMRKYENSRWKFDDLRRRVHDIRTSVSQRRCVTCVIVAGRFDNGLTQRRRKQERGLDE